MENMNNDDSLSMQRIRKSVTPFSLCSTSWWRHLAVVIVLYAFYACDLERIEPSTNTGSKFNTSVGGNSNDFPLDVLPLPDGNFIIAGRTQSFTADQNNQMYIVKVNPSGILIDQNNFGYDGDDWAVAVTPVSDGGFILAGRTTNALTFDVNIFVLKVDSKLDEVWRNSFGAEDSTEVAFGIVPTGTSDFLVGYTQSYISGGNSEPIRFLRINANGAKVFNKTSATPLAGIWKMIKTSDNKIVVTGGEYSQSKTYTYIAKFSEDANYIWSQTFLSPNQEGEFAYSVVEMNDKSLVIGGYDYPAGSGFPNFLTVNYSEIGMEQDNNIWGGANSDEVTAITKSTDGEIVVLGYTNSFSGSLEIYLSKRKKVDGTEIWAKHFGDSWALGGDVELCPDGGFVLVTGQNQPDADIVIVKTDANGEFQ